MNILLIDDHPLFCFGFAQAVRLADPQMNVREVHSLAEGLALAASWAELDMVLIDYHLGGDNGLSGLREFGAAHPLVVRVLISGTEEQDLPQRARLAGASGFFSKSMRIDALLQAIRSIAGGQQHFQAQPPVAGAGNVAAITPRQMQVLMLGGEGCSNKQIARQLGIAERTVKLHITALLDALHARNRTHLIIRARDLGLLR